MTACAVLKSRPELMPTGMSLSPTCLKTTRLAARRAAVCWTVASFARQSCWMKSTVTTSLLVWLTDLRRFAAAEMVGAGTSASSDEAEEVRSMALPPGRGEVVAGEVEKTALRGTPRPERRVSGGGMYVTPKFGSTQYGHAAGSDW